MHRINSIEELAHHEASHAVVNYYFNHPVRRLDLTTYDENSPTVFEYIPIYGENRMFTKNDGKEYEYIANQSIIALMAGGLGGQLATGQFNTDGCINDLRKARELISYLLSKDNEIASENKMRSLFGQCLGEAKELIEQTPHIQKQISALASSLLEKKQLSGTEAINIINASTPEIVNRSKDAIPEVEIQERRMYSTENHYA
ncbi:MAG: hypothetical protein CL792_01250 [Chloroflexi bacterium]|nr:hypothetical protein [Chloroflexota bacterium]|tara:strand:+ start:8924 stop:9529 length:606 start_codon:yes stop_codon:yes gene_type:complete